MEFQEFVREKERMCKEITCLKCPLNELDAGTKCSYACFANPEKAEKIVSDWLKEHPILTNEKKLKQEENKMIELTDKIKSEVKSLVDESDTHLDFWTKFCEYLYRKGFEDGKVEKEQGN